MMTVQICGSYRVHAQTYLINAMRDMPPVTSADMWGEFHVATALATEGAMHIDCHCEVWRMSICYIERPSCRRMAGCCE